MIKAGLILGAVMLVLGIGASLISPMCVPCLALAAGIGAGYLAGVYDKPRTSGNSAKVGAVAGTIGGAGALIGQLIGGILNATIVGPEGAAQLLRQLGLPTVGDPTFYYLSFIGGALCFGVVDIVLMAAFGALGGILWQQFTGKSNSTTYP